MENKYQQPSRYNSFIKNCTEQCKREMLYKDPLNLNSERKYHKASTVEIKHYDPEVDTIPEKLLETPKDSQIWIKHSENPEYIYSDHIDKVEIYVTRHFGTMSSKGKLCWIRLKVNHTVYGEGGYRSTDYYEITLNEVK